VPVKKLEGMIEKAVIMNYDEFKSIMTAKGKKYVKIKMSKMQRGIG
jgi:hypothetical protein